MTHPPDECALRRILVAIDASPPSLDALDAAAELAARTGAELVGLFVEDAEFLRLAGLPFVHHLSLPSGAGHPLDAEGARAQLKALAGEGRAALVAAVGRNRVSGSFRVVRGMVAAEVLAAAREADLVILGRASRPLVRRGRLGRTARAAAETAPGPVLLWSKPFPRERRILVVHDGSPGSRKALELAQRLWGGNGPFAVLAEGGTEQEACLRAEEASLLLARRAAAVSIRALVGLGALRGEIASQSKAIVVVSADSLLFRDEEGLAILDQIAEAVLLVR